MSYSQSPAFSVGERLELRRRQRGLSRRALANLVGRSEEWLRLVESGRSPLDSIEVVTRLADVLCVDDPAELINWSRPIGRQRPLDDAELRPLREVVVCHPALDGTQGADVPDHTELARDVDMCAAMWFESSRRFSELSAVLPDVLWRSRVARWRRQDQSSAELLVRAYHAARLLLTGIGDHSMAATVADRAIGTAAQIGSPGLVAVSAWHVSESLMALGYLDKSHDYAVAAAARVGAADGVDDGGAIVAGALRLTAARASARARHGERTDRLLEVGRAAAAPLRGDVCVGSVQFGPSECALVAIDIALVRRDVELAIDLTNRLDLPESDPPSRRARYYLYQADAYASRNDDAAVALALSRVAEVSSEDLRYDAMAHRCIQHVLRRDNQIARREISRIAQLAGIA